jgi:misacylated tRNA(Ala) deacylase
VGRCAMTDASIMPTLATERLFLDASEQGEMTATVLASGPDGIILNRTVFYARSGGQPGDQGLLRWTGGEATVIDTLKGPGEAILHIIRPGSALPAPGAQVQGALDWPRRQALMRMHTALHLLCAALPGAGVTGGQIGAERSRLDLDLPQPPAREAIEARLYALIAADHAVSSEWVDDPVLDANPTLVRTLSVQPPRGAGRLRLIRIGPREAPVDLQPCGGTHVARTREIGGLAVVKIENKGKQNRRIVIALAQEGQSWTVT